MAELEEVIERMWLPVDLSVESGQSDSVFGMFVPFAFPTVEDAQGHSLEIAMWYWDHLDGKCDRTQLSSLYKL